MLHELVSQNGNLGSSPQNEYWRNGRKLAGATITAANLKAYDSFQVDEAARLVRDLIANPKSYAYLFERYSSVVTIRILYDKNISGTPHEAEHIKTITTVVRTLEKTGAPGAYIVDFLPILKNLPNFMAPFKREAKELHNFEYSYFRALTDEAMKQYDPTTHQGPRALIQTYLDKKDGYGLSEFEIAYCLGTLFEGGSGTTSAAMQSYCLAMWHYPEWQTKVQKEIDEVVGSERLPSFDDWPSLPVVRAAMKETLRWRPVVPGGRSKILPTMSSRRDTPLISDRHPSSNEPRRRIQRLLHSQRRYRSRKPVCHVRRRVLVSGRRNLQPGSMDQPQISHVPSTIDRIPQLEKIFIVWFWETDMPRPRPSRALLVHRD